MQAIHALLLLLLPSTIAASSSTVASSVSTSIRVENSDDMDMPTATASSFKHVVFSDVDGTLVHYPEHLQKGGDDSESDDGDNDAMIFLPPSKTGTRGVISTRTLQLCHRLRHGVTTTSEGSFDNQQQRAINGGVALILVSGMRTTTLFQRLPYLPRADAYVSESGGRIFYPRLVSNEQASVGDGEVDGEVKDLIINPVTFQGIHPFDSTPYTLVEDMRWRNQISRQNAAGSDGYNDQANTPQQPTEERKGMVWEFAQQLKKQGYVLDTHGYATAFRINRKMQSTHSATFDAFLEKCANREGIPDELGCSTNLGCVDIYPAMSGKKNACDYLIQRFLGGDEAREVSLKTHAFCLCDDDNDIEMAQACRTAFLPSVTSESIQRIVDSQIDNDDGDANGKLIVTEDVDRNCTETRATEAALELILDELTK
eukprot:g2661.t1 g2661   contig12:565928-567211(+)